MSKHLKESDENMLAYSMFFLNGLNPDFKSQSICWERIKRKRAF